MGEPPSQPVYFYPYTLPPTADKRSVPEVMREESWPCPSPAAALGRLGQALGLGSTVELTLVAGFAGENKRPGRLTSSDTSQAQIQSFELAHPNVYPVNELLEYMKGHILQIL